ncbi:MAG: hypothetical protein HYT27_03640 [Parcubacteria group bacterium]|nr:hypothetical protein [Parcubacteria group bacterium]
MSFEHKPSTPLEKPRVKTIRNAAIRFKGKIFEGTTHHHALGALLEHLKDKEPKLYKKVGGDEYQLIAELERRGKKEGDFFDFEGFVTTSGAYVTRTNATKIISQMRQARD